MCPLVCQAHEAMDGFGLGAPKCFSEISLKEAITESIDCPLVGDVFGGVAQPSQCEMYKQRVSPILCMHSRGTSKDVGLLYVPLKSVMKIYPSSSHEPIDSGLRLLSQALAESLKCSCSTYIVLSLDPPPTVTAVRKSSS
jgi:hypothetical protein